VQLPDRSYRRWGRNPDELRTIEDVRIELAREQIRNERWRRRRNQLYVLVGLLAAAGIVHPFGMPWPL
jgi:hypothetical protein